MGTLTDPCRYIVQESRYHYGGLYGRSLRGCSLLLPFPAVCTVLKEFYRIFSFGRKRMSKGGPAGNRAITITLPGSLNRREQRTGTGRNLAGVHALVEPCHAFGGCTVREGVGHNISL